MSRAAFAAVVMTGVLTLPNEVTAQVQPTAGSPAPPSAAKSDRALIQHKLKSIIIDKVDFNKTDIADVIQFLVTKSKELDPDKVGVNIVYRLTPMNDAGQGAPSPTRSIHREVTIVLENVPLSELLTYITEQANLQYSVEDYAVYLRPAVDGAEALTVRTFLPPANFFQAVSPGKEINAKDELTKLGIQFPVGATATFLPQSGKVVVRNTPEQLDLIATLIERLNASAAPPAANN
jgi:general secretion pathway protein D